MARSLEEKFQAQEKKLGLLSKNMVDAIWVLDPETMKYTYISHSVKQLRGYSEQESMTLHLKDQLTPDSFQKVMHMLVEALTEYKTNKDVKRVLELEMYHKRGHTVWVEITAQLASEKDGRIKIFGVTRNISERKFFEQERENLIQQLAQALEEQKRLQKENKILQGLLPICMECKKIRDEEGNWWQLEEYIASRADVTFSHTYCPECKELVLRSIR
ncbi:MAG: PAS domain S-box protein [Deltaproteobacteria bacterium]|nr:PAS domain S-box protein [Deltaproteobacteria bacterium]